MKKIKIPVISSDYVKVFCPEKQVYTGPDGNELKKGQFYEEWVPNDHTFIQEPNNRWHSFGITHPLTSIDNIHEGEVLLYHAVADGNAFDNITEEMFRDRGCILPPDERPGEPIEIHSPYIVKIGNI